MAPGEGIEPAPGDFKRVVLPGEELVINGGIDCDVAPPDVSPDRNRRQRFKFNRSLC